MPSLNPNFVIGLGVTIIIQLESKGQKHSNTKILQASFLILSFARFGTKKATQKFIILWWKTNYVFTRFEDTLRHSWMASWLGAPMRFVFYVALDYTHFRRTL
jgi:hypothetical protein